jgi:hypothetical protein
MARQKVLNRLQEAGVLAHQLAALAQEITHGALLLGIDVALGQPPQAQELRQPACIGLVIAVLQPAVLYCTMAAVLARCTG